MVDDIVYAPLDELLEDGKRRVSQVVTPGDVITADAGYMRGHGTFQLGDELIASVAGVVHQVLSSAQSRFSVPMLTAVSPKQVNKLICVRPLRSRYVPEIGDVVVGRITEVGQRRWKVDIHTRLDAVLMLSSVNLPGGCVLSCWILVRSSHKMWSLLAVVGN